MPYDPDALVSHIEVIRANRDVVIEVLAVIDGLLEAFQDHGYTHMVAAFDQLEWAYIEHMVAPLGLTPNQLTALLEDAKKVIFRRAFDEVTK